MHEFVRGLEPLNESLVLWRDLAVGNGPFHRVEHALVRFGIPSESPRVGLRHLPVLGQAVWLVLDSTSCIVRTRFSSKQVALRLRV